MNEEPMEIIKGSGNIFADFLYPHSDIEQLKSLLAAEIINVLDKRKLTVRKAKEITGFAAADFSRIRGVKLEKFTIDRLMNILDKLDQIVDIKLSVHTRRKSMIDGNTQVAF